MGRRYWSSALVALLFVACADLSGLSGDENARPDSATDDITSPEAATGDHDVVATDGNGTVSADAADAGEAKDGGSADDAGDARIEAGSDAPTVPTCAADPSWANVVLLLRMNGTDKGTAFVDESAHAHTVTNTSTQTMQFGAKYGTSGRFDGSTDYLTIADSPDWDFGTADFTIETWVKAESNVYEYVLARQLSAGLPTRAFALYLGNPTLTFVFDENAPSLATASALTTAWHHVAVTRQASAVTIWVDGVESGSTGFATAVATSTQPLVIGRYGDINSNYLKGMLDDLRITKGVARYSTTFTPPGELPVCP